MTPREIVATLDAAGVRLWATEAGKLGFRPTPDPDLLALLGANRDEVLSYLRDPDQQCGVAEPDDAPSPMAEFFEEERGQWNNTRVVDPAPSVAIEADGWARSADGAWECQPGWWASHYPTTPEGHEIDWDGIDALRAANVVPLPAENLPGLRPLTEKEKRQIRTAGASLPAGVSYGQTPTGQWRRLT